jgi:ribonucleotide monophosphatase NagD (HAD superfamily)
MGGTSHYFGKPHPPIYLLAAQRLAAIAGQDIAPSRILCIGDGINTDIRGAMGEDLDALFITGGLAAAETHTDGQPDPKALETFLKTAEMAPRYAIGHLR